MIDDTNDETNFPHKVLVTDKQVSTLWKPFLSNSSDNTKFSKTQLSQIMQPQGFLGRLLGLLLVCI